MSQQTADPHAHAEVLQAGAPLESANAAVVLIHGRGATAKNILQLNRHLSTGMDPALRVAFLAPQAAGNTWYPERFIAPLEHNEPWLSSALAMIDRTVDTITAAGVPGTSVMIAGFSQGACLSLEYVARGSRRLGGAAALSGALIGPTDEPHAPLADVAGMPVFLGVGEYDDHVAPALVQQSAELFQEAGAKVDFRFYEAMGHSMTEDEIVAMRDIIRTLPAE
ncbi:MAG TPA: dienelactone hydrolase family protein [Thermomicrobiales bacterium]|nr:dienelactone hydrolase family protein [Thermomicrobiales bacterium]